MRKDIFKKIGLISKSGFLASSLIKIEAMNEINDENKIINKNEIINESKIINKNEIITLEQILKKDLSSDDTFNKIDKLYNKLDSEDTSLYKIINKEDFLELIETYKEDILYPIKFGNEARKNAYDLAKKLREYIYKKEKEKEKESGEKKDLSSYRQILALYFIHKQNYINLKTTESGKFYDPIIKSFKNENINNEIFKINKDFDCSKLILIHPDKFYNNQIHNIGRNVLHEITKDIYNENLYGEDKGSSELKRLFNGEMNCTCNTFMLYTFLRLNKILCYNYMIRGHEFVLIPLKDEENEAINFYKVELDEKGTINDMSFSVKNIIEISKNKIWEGMNIDKNKGISLLLDYSIYYNGFTPTYMYYKNLRDFIDNIIRKIKKEKYKIKKKDIELIKYYLNGLKNAWKYINKKHKDKYGNYIVKFLPIEKGNCLFLPNVLDLGEPKFVKCNDVKSSYHKIMFKSLKNPEEYVDLMYANIHVPDKYNYENIEDVKLKINKIDFELYKIEYSISYKDGIEIFINNQKSNIENNKCAHLLKKVCDLNND